MENLKKINDFHKNQMDTILTCLSGKENKIVEDMVEEEYEESAGEHDCMVGKKESAGNVNDSGECNVCGKTDLL